MKTIKNAFVVFVIVSLLTSVTIRQAFLQKTLAQEMGAPVQQAPPEKQASASSLRRLFLLDSQTDKQKRTEEELTTRQKSEREEQKKATKELKKEQKREREELKSEQKKEQEALYKEQEAEKAKIIELQTRKTAKTLTVAREKQIKVSKKSKRYVEITTSENDPIYIASAAVLDAKTMFLKIKKVEFNYKLVIKNQTPKIINSFLIIWERSITFLDTQTLTKETKISKPMVPYEKRIVEYNEVDSKRPGEVYRVKIARVIFEDGTEWINPAASITKL